ncbi:hypothetical protein OKE68_10595 [Riemerella anatipestifer]|uniref:Uncharacterized protein n=1 Tax=Riemerella anatipestifer TaxID=34085 RepID=A0AAP3AMQ7_RIEAN|nr:hypothetical protein [Riemerella anatipestifer]MBT0573663.1 hypothetical protein [Riemerella anatipestifer]MCU7569220.1 hypothetical protein [Riemerella anatipestifer]MCW0491189.1 hypothetical protein [Riemerella anatipestifer]MCW0524760.1 hypothetical protein [Riemerella anatipestifer]MDD1539261.1 hypothetical protein [Riemerella anatipestifer]
MLSIKTKTIKLLAYDIDNEDIKAPYSDLFEKLKEKLGYGESADTRRMKLNLSSSDEDLLSDFAITDRYVYGVMWRISPSKEIPRIPDDYFSNPKIQIDDIFNNDEKIQLTCKEHYYFALNNHFLVTNLPKSRIKSLEVYLNWLLLATRGDKSYNFTSKIKVSEQIKLNEIKHISLKSSQKKEKNENGFKVFGLGTELLKKLISDTKNLDDIVRSNIFSSRLLISISKPRKMPQQEYEKLLGTYMTPISHADGVSFKLKNGKTISGENMLQYKEVEIELIDDNRISERDLVLEMEKYLRELKNL